MEKYNSACCFMSMQLRPYSQDRTQAEGVGELGAEEELMGDWR
jgi:hypothetical protein